MVKSFDLGTIAERIGGRLDGPSDLPILRLAGVEAALDGDLTFVGAARYMPFLESTRASAVILTEDIEFSGPCIRVDDPAAAFVRALHIFALPREELFPPGIHETAVIDPTARLGEGVHIGPHACIGAGCEIADRVVVGASSVLLYQVQVGEDSLIYPRVSVQHGCVIGARVIIHSGAVIGSDGFGLDRRAESVEKIPQVGIVRLGDDVEIGANACVDRATAGETVLESAVKVDNLVQIAHNVQIGERTAISAQTGISGSTKVGRDVIMAGQVGLADHMSVGDGVMVGAQSGLHGTIAPGSVVSGTPARDHREWRRMNAHLSRLERYAREIADLKRRVAELEQQPGDGSR